VTLATPSRQRAEDNIAQAVKRLQTQVLAARTEPLAREVSRTFQTLLESCVHDPQGSLPPLKAFDPDDVEWKAGQAAWPGVTYSIPEYDAFEKKLEQVLTKEWIKVGGISLKGVQANLGITIAFDLNERLLPKGIIARQVTKVSDTTKVGINKTIKQGIADGVHPSVIAKRLQDQISGWGGFGFQDTLTKSRAYTIARTETANAYNVGAILGYQKSGLINLARCIDSPSCGYVGHNSPDLANGKVVPLDEAMVHPISHPNCVRAWAPVVASQQADIQGAPQPKPVGSQLGDYANPKDWSRIHVYGAGTTVFENYFGDLLDSLNGVTDKMRFALNRYQGAGYRYMNSLLRGDGKYPGGPDIAGYAKLLQDYIAKFELPDAVVTHRGVGRGSAFAEVLGEEVRTLTEAQAKRLIGKVITDKGFFSTALSSRGKFGGVHLELTAPKGAHAVPVSQKATGAAKGYDGQDYQRSMSEAELLFQAGTRYVIDKVEYSGFGTIKLIGHILH
jgi:hypothetical protein